MYSARVNGEPTTFGTSGLLYRSNKLMYDRATESLWNQFTGEPVIGPLERDGESLEFFPSELTTWELWAAAHPDTTVISDATGVYASTFYLPESDPNAIYYEYFNTPGAMFPIANSDGALRTKEMVMGIEIGGAAKAYAIDQVRSERVINDVVGGVNIVVIGASDSQAARAYQRGELTFRLGAGNGGLPTLLEDASGVDWQVTEDALISEVPGGPWLARIPSVTSFWHGWFSFHPDTALLGPDTALLGG